MSIKNNSTMRAVVMETEGGDIQVLDILEWNASPEDSDKQARLRFMTRMGNLYDEYIHAETMCPIERIEISFR